MGAGYLATIHQDNLKPVSKIFASCEGDAGQRQELMGKSPGYLFHTIVDALVDNMLELVRKNRGNISDIEDAAFDERVFVTKEVSFLRQQTMALRRMAADVRATLQEFGTKDIQRFSGDEDLEPYFDDVKDHLEEAVRTLDEAKETVEDTDSMYGIDKSNKIYWRF